MLTLGEQKSQLFYQQKEFSAIRGIAIQDKQTNGES